MVTGSACEVLRQESERFIRYVRSDKRIKRSIVDKESLLEGAVRTFRSDNALKNMIEDIEKAGKDPRDCIEPLFDEKDVQKLIERNIRSRKKDIRQRMKKQYPKLSPRTKKFRKELDRRLKISVGVSKSYIPKYKNIHIEKKSGGKKGSKLKASGSALGVGEPLSVKERLFLENRKGKPIDNVVREYHLAGLRKRTDASIREHFKKL